MTDQTLSMDEPKQKLIKLEELIPNDASCGLLYEFGRYLASRFNSYSQLVPAGFVLGCELALRNLQTERDGITGERPHGGLTGYPPEIYALLRAEIPRIADAIFPAEFATGVKTYIEGINAKMRAERTAK
ncbi:MAG: hypothetical protein Q7R73_02450 [bacterium]|nr:hypothetical protein [bacterium]